MMLVLSDKPECEFRGRTLPDLDRFIKAYTSHVLQRCGMNVNAAAKILGVGRTTIYRYLGEFVKENRVAISSDRRSLSQQSRMLTAKEMNALRLALPIIIYVRHGDRCSEPNCRNYRCQSGFIPEDYELVGRFAHLSDATAYCLQISEAGERARLVCYLNPSDPVTTDYPSCEVSRAD
jgi:hypothetical protein